MNSKPEQPESQSGEIEFSSFDELSAYLDGELDEKQTQEVENRLGSDSKYLAELQSLQKTWDYLTPCRFKSQVDLLRRPPWS